MIVMQVCDRSRPSFVWLHSAPYTSRSNLTSKVIIYTVCQGRTFVARLIYAVTVYCIKVKAYICSYNILFQGQGLYMQLQYTVSRSRLIYAVTVYCIKVKAYICSYSILYQDQGLYIYIYIFLVVFHDL